MSTGNSHTVGLDIKRSLCAQMPMDTKSVALCGIAPLKPLMSFVGALMPEKRLIEGNTMNAYIKQELERANANQEIEMNKHSERLRKLEAIGEETRKLRDGIMKMMDLDLKKLVEFTPDRKLAVRIKEIMYNELIIERDFYRYKYNPDFRKKLRARFALIADAVMRRTDAYVKLSDEDIEYINEGIKLMDIRDLRVAHKDAIERFHERDKRMRGLPNKISLKGNHDRL